MTQLGNTASTCAAQWKMWHLKVFSVIYFTAVCAAQESSDATKMYRNSNPTPQAMVAATVYDPPVPSLQLQSQWLDVFPSEKVEFNCSVNDGSDWTFSWYRDGLLVGDPSPGVSFAADGSVFTITAASQAFSGNYTCKGSHKTKGKTVATDSLELKVYANKPKPTVDLTSKFAKVFPRESVTFECKVDVFSGWDYLWYHNGNVIQGFNNKTYTIDSVDHHDSGQYGCKAKRGKDPAYTEQSETKTLQVSDLPTPSLTWQSWLDVFQSETVELSCEVGSGDWTFIWYKNGQQVAEDSDTSLGIGGSSLNITSPTQIHQGVYICKAQLESRRVLSGSSNPANVIVYDKTPKPTLSKGPDLNPMYVGERVTFTCKVTVSSGWEYDWYKDGTKLPDTKETISIHLDLSHGGKYKCKATRGGVTSTDYSEEMTHDVLEIPVPSLKPNNQWLDVFPTESVKFSCEMHGSLDWTYTWYRDGQQIPADNTADTATLSINSASSSHAGQYKCKGLLNGRSVSSNSSSGLTLKIHDKKPSVILTQDPEYKVMFAGESVSFSCDINVSSGWEYMWYQGDSLLTESSNKYSISSVGKKNSGSYKCKAKRGRSQEFLTDYSKAISLEIEDKKPKPSITQTPDVDKVYIGESVSFNCTLKISSGWEYSWYKDGTLLTNNSTNFSIHNANSLNNGIYKCMARRYKTMFNTEHSDGRMLHISEIPVPSLQQVSQWLDVFPDESVKLSCGMEIEKDWTYTWYRNGQVIHADDVLSFGSDGTTLSISSASALHSGQYSCSGKLKNRNVNSIQNSGLLLRVYDTEPRIILMQNPDYKLMHTGDSVSFRCHINVSSGWNYLWYKDGTQLAVSENTYNISSVATTNAGSYTCKAKREDFHTSQTQALILEVEERPRATIDLLTGWSEVFSTDNLVLKCEVEGQDTWNYTWFKEGQPIDLPPSEKHTVTPQDNPEQSLYLCQGIRSERPTYSKRSSSFATKNLLLKRRLLLSILGCLFFGLIFVVIGCIVLRVIRKRVDDDDKPEEAELFLTMAQLKDRADAPCPMVDYITDEALNDPSKEGDENGKICSESTPLPITFQEDQAVTTESLDTAENNGGLVSFKQ